MGKTCDGFSNVSPSKCSSTSMIVTSPPLDCFDTLPSEGPFVGPLPPLFQYKCSREDNFTDHPSSKHRCLARSVSQAISSSQLTSPLTELKRKREDDIFDSSPSKRPNLGPPPPPEPSAQPSSTQYKRKREVDSTDPPSSKRCFLTRSVSQAISLSQLTNPFIKLKRKREDDDVEGSPSKRPNLSSPPSTQYKRKCEVDSTNPTSSKPFLAHSLSRVIPSSSTTSVTCFLPRKSEVSNSKNSNASAHPENRFKHQYLYSLTNFLTRS